MTLCFLGAVFLLGCSAYWWGDVHREPYLEDQPTYLTLIPSHVNKEN